MKKKEVGIVLSELKKITLYKIVECEKFEEFITDRFDDEFTIKTQNIQSDKKEVLVNIKI